MPLISVIIPVYNGEKTIAETLQSVLKQSFSDFELIVIDDGSQDSTLEIISQHPDPRLKVFSYPNAGLAASRNRGINLAAGEFIAFVDADDLWTTDKLESQVKALQRDPDAALAYSWTDYIDASGCWFQSGTHTTVRGDAFPKLLLFNFIENGSNPLIRKEVFAKVGYFDESLKAAEDWDMYLRIAARYPFVAVPTVQVLYRRMNSMSSNIRRQETETLKVLDRAFEKAPKSLQHLKKHSLAKFYKYLIFKSLESSGGWKQAWMTIRCLRKAIAYNPSLLKHGRTLASVLVKVSAMAVHP